LLRKCRNEPTAALDLAALVLADLLVVADLAALADHKANLENSLSVLVAQVPNSNRFSLLGFHNHAASLFEIFEVDWFTLWSIFGPKRRLVSSGSE
jgi:hypothetical protein